MYKEVTFYRIKGLSVEMWNKSEFIWNIKEHIRNEYKEKDYEEVIPKTYEQYKASIT